MGDHHHHHHHHMGKDSKNILIAFLLNFSFAILELFGGYYTNSVAIISDALHDFGDSLALLFSFFAEKISKKAADDKFTFGYRRFSILSSFINGLILLGGSLFVIYEAVSRLLHPQEVKPEGMLGLAILGIIVNAYAAYRLSKNDGLNTKMVMYHLLEDLLGWIAVLIVSIILMFKPWYQLDSILSILISLLILRGVYKNLIKVSLIFLQRFPDELELATIKDKLLKLELISDIHAIKGWSIDSETYYLRFHVRVPENTMIREIDHLKKEIKTILHEHKVKYSTIEFEANHYECS
tara:strand:+ start:245135 stop:246019 length:885 start_codon:yes stop_codon:yes gene_type:complete